MQPVIYDVAVSADGFIAGPDEDISKFPHQGRVVDDYRDRLASYGCAIMGRATYAFGYRFGMQPGDNPYPHMRTIIFSRTLELPANRSVEIFRSDAADFVRNLKESSEKPVYLCGGGALASFLLGEGLIDRLRLKRAPVLLGSGVPLFRGEGAGTADIRLNASVLHEDGVLFQEFAVTA